MLPCLLDDADLALSHWLAPQIIGQGDLSRWPALVRC